MSQRRRFIIEAHFHKGLKEHEEKTYYFFGVQNKENLYTPDMSDARMAASEKGAQKLFNEVRARDFGNMKLEIKEIMVEVED